jgi:ubiquinone/menaquinone biosynthesis C-methylase UbiE
MKREEITEARMPDLKQQIRAYWNEHIHDLAIARHPVGTRGFFEDLAEYRFDKLRYLPRVVDFSAYRGKRLLEVGCGVAIDLVRFAAGGAQVVGIDLAETSIELARKNFEYAGLKGEFYVMDGEAMEFDDDSFDVVYAHGVIQYTADDARMIREIHRVLKPGGEAIMMVYNRLSWLNFLSKIMKVELEHEDAPVLRKYSIKEFRQLLEPFSEVNIVPERFPVKTRLHTGVKAFIYNTLFVGTFNLLPKWVVRPLGWHIMAFARK